MYFIWSCMIFRPESLFKAAQSNMSNMVVLNKWVLTKYEASTTDNITLIQFIIYSKLI